MFDLIVTVLVAAFPVLVTVAACYDLLTMQIPNRFPVALALAFLIAAFAAGLPVAAIGIHLAIGAGVLVGTFALFAFGYLGGGDAKLAAATVLWLGLDQTFPFLIYTALYGGALSLAILGLRSLPLPAFLLEQAWATRLHEKGAGVPYGIALAAGALTVFPDTAWFTALARL